MNSTQVIKFKQCSKLSLGRELPNEGRHRRTVCSQRLTRYTHEKRKKKPIRFRSTAWTWGKLRLISLFFFVFFFVFFVFFLSSWISFETANPGSVTTHDWESQKPQKNCSIWLFGIWCWKWQKHIFIKYNINNIIISENYILPLTGAFFFIFFPSPASDWPFSPPNQTR